MKSGESWDTLAEALLLLAKRSGAEAAEVFQSRSLSRPVFFEANRLKQLESSQSEGTALRVWRQGRPGLVVAYGEIEPQVLVDKALGLSRLNPPETLELTPGKHTRYADMGQPVSVEQLIGWGQQAIALVRQEYPEVLCEAELDCEVETTRLVNSLGLDCSYSDTTLSGSLSAEWVRGEDFLSVGDGQIRRNSLDPVHLAQQILQRLHWAQRNVAPPLGRVPILFTAKAADVLWGTMQAALSGKRVIEQSSPWCDRIGEQVTSPLLTLSQDPEAGPFSCPFDDEGTPTQPLIFLDQGVLRLFYTDRTVGRELGGGSTGNGFRPSLGSYPTPGLFNTLIRPGMRSLPDLMASLDHGLVIDQILGSGGGISGEISINVDLGYRVHQGEILGRVKDTMVAGNIYTALKHIQALGADAAWNGACYTPSVVVAGLSTTGGGLAAA
ncbi:Metalloprotease TldD [Halomicronema hongdechloris C2206]|uniref:Metalloprotease TldD n=1 Tax=Halomicronema hongdechloris C2206 TaxID=1641165 RepID=A0A1Z3HKA8_9CYAN|nr:TldD/PmbA family protein [Halomicronema hongdechloris]ASC70751.1 Metalloprotease TldD [Halomicronema hongdechloris C2206]